MENGPNPLGADVPDFQINEAEVSALLQARGLGQVGAILARGGTPTKNGGKSLFMLRRLASEGYLTERAAEDEDHKTIVYFDLAKRADLGFLDQCASAAIVELCKRNDALESANNIIRDASDKAGIELKVLSSDLSELEAEFRKIMLWAAEIEAVAGQFADGETGTPEACSAIGVKAKAIVDKIQGMVGE